MKLVLCSFAILTIQAACYAQASSAVTIGSVVNATGYQPQLAPDTVFVIFGGGMGPSSIVTVAAPYPDSLGGTSITFTPSSGGNAITPKMIYSLASQVAGLLPSSITPGTYAVRVTYNGQTSAPQNVTVVARSFGIATANSSGSGNAQATIGNVNGGLSLTRFTTGGVSFGGYDWTLSPAHPTDTLVFWGTGGGADPANDSGGSSGDQTTAGNFVVIVGGRQITPLFAGASSGFPGLWQVNFTLPGDITTGCFVYVQIRAGGNLSNGVNLPIAPLGQSSCSEPGLTPAFLAKLDAGSPITAASFAIASITIPVNNTTQVTASGFVGRYSAAAWLLPNIGPRYGFCPVFDRTFAVGGIDPASPTAELDAGPRLSLSGPNLPAGFALGVTSTPLGTFYSGSPGTGGLASGTYTLSGPGGSQVGTFMVSAVFPSSFTATNFNSINTVDRTQPLTVSWTGSGFDRVYVQLTTNTRAASMQRIVTLNCVIPASLGSYAIPAAALAYLQPGPANLAVEGMSTEGTFTANLTAGGQIDRGAFVADLGIVKDVTVQ